MIQQTLNQLTETNSQQVQQLQAEIDRLKARIQQLEEKSRKEKESSNPNINFPVADNSEILRNKLEIEKKEKKINALQRLANQGAEESSSKALQFRASAELKEVAERLEKFDHKQSENK